VLLLEDLLARNVIFGAGTAPLEADGAATALELLARLHARWWGKGPVGWSGANVWESERHLAHFFSPANWDTYLTLPRAADVPDELRERSRVERAVLRMWETDRELPRCFAHGDAQLPNMYFGRDGAPGFLDFGTVTTSTWALDVPYFLIGSLTVSDRRNHERDLLNHYLGQLQAHGADGPSFDDAWRTYRKHALHGFLLITTPEGHFLEEGVKANVDRFASAITDLESLASLED
jgi:aminoglycoside phosphotransferase (APT) family kinase protein